MPTKSKITYADGRTEDIELPTPEEMDMAEQDIINSIPDGMWNLLFDESVTKESVLDSFKNRGKA